MRTLRPWRARSLPAIRPEGPAPTMMTSLRAYCSNCLRNPPTMALVTSYSPTGAKIGIPSSSLYLAFLGGDAEILLHKVHSAVLAAHRAGLPQRGVAGPHRKGPLGVQGQPGLLFPVQGLPCPGQLTSDKHT